MIFEIRHEISEHHFGRHLWRVLSGDESELAVNYAFSKTSRCHFVAFLPSLIKNTLTNEIIPLTQVFFWPKVTPLKVNAMEKLTVRDFFQRFPDDDSCLDHIMNVRYGMRHKCGSCGSVDTTFHRIAGRRAYACASCGTHLYPCAGTIFQDSSTKLQLWFYAIYLFVVTRHGVSGKELERQVGVTYKTAWRMGQKIRELAGKADFRGMLAGHVEVDETNVGGARPGLLGRGTKGKTIEVGSK